MAYKSYRSDSEEAERIVRRILPDESLRRDILGALYQSVVHVATIAPDKWGLTLFSNRFRLNAGQIETFVVRPPQVYFVVHGPDVTAYPEGATLTDDDPQHPGLPYYRHVPDGVKVAVRVEEWPKLKPLLPAHHRLLEVAAQDHIQVKVPEAHSPGFVAYLARYLGRPECQPAYCQPQPDESVPVFEEGWTRQVTRSTAERSREAREACLRHFGTACRICGIDFSAVYGEIGRGHIHVHHLKPISQTKGRARAVDPIRDLVPVCANCHEMVHRRNPPYSPDELRERMCGAGVRVDSGHG